MAQSQISAEIRPKHWMARHPAFYISVGILGVFLIIAILAPLLAPYSPVDQDLVNRRVAPVWFQWLYADRRASWAHLFGTDGLGRDYLSRAIYGLRISLMIGFLATLVSGVLGTALGMIAGYYRGRADMIIGFLITTRLSIPLVLVALAIVSLYGGSKVIIIAVLGLLLWDRFAVVMRSVTIQACRQDYVAAARAIGCSDRQILLGEILPNVLTQLAIVASVELSAAILVEASLSFLGLGVPPPEPSLGLMLSEARNDMFFAAWVIAIPGTILFMLVFSINLIGDGLRDVMTKGRSS